MPAMQLHWDIFCRVIDNYGDIGVCWRLARQLANEHGKAVRLWVDDPASLVPLCPQVDPATPRQQVQGVDIRHWPNPFSVDRVADVVIEAFACELPETYVAAMAAATPNPCWINLEYLTAETWADSCHGMASPHPIWPLVKHFFFPGFSPATGGLLRESTLLAEPDPLPPAAGEPLEISLFCYTTAPLDAWLEALAATPEPVLCRVAAGQPLAAVAACLGGDGPWQLGNARLVPQPFLPLDEYDRLLRRCAINFVRGEDSFVRAQWAGRPFVWQVYRQDDAAHLLKLDAFVDRYCAAMDGALAATTRALFTAWNTGQGIASAWPAFFAQRAAIARHNVDWARQLAAAPDLTTTLVKFCRDKV